MTTSTTVAGVVDAPSVDTVHPHAIRSTGCVSAERMECGENFPDDDYAYHFDTRTEMLAAINATDWSFDEARLWCNNCAPGADQLVSAGDIQPDTLHWLVESSCFTIQCTRCQQILESDCGEAHFHSTRAATEAAVRARWMVSPHQVWCRTCTALGEPPPIPDGK